MAAAAANGHSRRDKLRTKEVPSRYLLSPSSTSTSPSSSSSSSSSVISWISGLRSPPADRSSSRKVRNWDLKGVGFDRRRRWSGSICASDNSDTQSSISFVDSDIGTPLRCSTKCRGRFPLPKLVNSKDCRSRTASPALIHSPRLREDMTVSSLEKKAGRSGKVQPCSQWRGRDTVGVTASHKQAGFTRVGDGDQRIFDAQLLKFLCNQQLQWRFLNARAGVHMCTKRVGVEKDLLKVWIGISEVLHSVTIKKKKLQSCVQNLKLIYMLKQQMQFLEEVDYLGKDLSSSLAGTIDATQTTTISIPTVNGAKTSIQPLKDAFYSAVDVLSAITSSTSSFFSKQVEEMEGLMDGMNDIAMKESFLTYQCWQLLYSDSPMREMNESLTAHLLQVDGQSPIGH